MEERIYRLRCVEAGAGYSLGGLFVGRVDRRSGALQCQYVEFVTLADPKTMPGVRSSVLGLAPCGRGLRPGRSAAPADPAGLWHVW